MATINVTEFINAFKTEIVPELTNAIMAALAADDAPKRAWRGGAAKKSDYEVLADQVIIRPYSDKTTCVYGDLKNNDARLSVVKSFGSDDEGKKKASFRQLTSVPEQPLGWILVNAAIDAHGGIDALQTALEATGCKVAIEESVAEVTKARKDERKEERKAAAEEKPKADKAPATPAPTVPIEAAKPTEQPKAPAKPAAVKPAVAAPAPAKPEPAAPAIPEPVWVKAKCFDPTKDEAEFAEKSLDIAVFDGYGVYQGSKGYAIYVKVCTDIVDNSDVYVRYKAYKGDHNPAAPLAEWKVGDVPAAVKAGKITANAAIVQAVARGGEDYAADLDLVWEAYCKVAAA